jgi:hypothetical protein
MKKVYISAFTLMCLPSLFGQKFNNVYDFGSDETVIKAINASDNAVQVGTTNKKNGSSLKGFNVLWSENFGTTSSSTDILTTPNGVWTQNLNSKDSTFWSLTSTHPMNSSGYTDALDGTYLSWDSYSTIYPYEVALNKTDATTPVKGSIVSPSIDLSKVAGGIMLNFKSQGMFCCNASSIPFKISISEDNGVTWQDTLTVNFGIMRNQSSDQIAKPAEFTLDLSEYTKAHSANTKLKFIWDDGTVPGPSKQLNTYYFWLIDDIQVYEKPLYDFELENLWLGDIRNENEYTSIPKDFAGKLTVQAKVHKLGSSIPTNAKLKVTVTGGSVNEVVEGGTFSNNLLKEFDTITFVTTIDLSTYNAAQYKVKGELVFTETDTDPSNNALTRTLNVTDNIYGQRDYEQGVYYGSIGRGQLGLETTTDVSKAMGFGNEFFIPKDASLEGINLFIGNHSHYQTNTGELLVDLYTFDPTKMNFQDAHKDVTPAGSWSFDITSDMVCTPTPCEKYVTLNFNKTTQGPPTLLGGKYYVALINHAGGKNNHFCYLDQPMDYDKSSHVKGDFGTTAGNNWYYSGRQIIVDLNFDKSLSTNTIEKDITVGFIAPNPTSGETTVGFSIKSAQDIVIEVVDLTGKTLISKVEKGLAAGSHFSSFDAGILSSGVYCVNIKTESAISTQKFIKK